MYHRVSEIYPSTHEHNWDETQLMWHINLIRTESNSSFIKQIPNIYFHQKMVPENMNEQSSKNSSKWITRRILALSESHEQVIEKFIIILNR